MATGKFVAGAYSATYNAKALGQAGQGFTLSHETFKRIITGDAGGDAPQDAIYRGKALSISFRLIEALEAAIPDLMWAYASTIGTLWDLGIIGLMDVRGQGSGSPTTRAKSLVLTALTGTSAANDGPATMTMPLTSLSEGFPVDVLHAPDLREVPVRLRIYYTIATGLFGSQT